MKCKFLGLVAIMAAICLICSCGNGSSDSEGAAQKTVPISFAVSTENGALRTLAVDFDGINVDKYQYKATPLFSSEFGDPQGVQTTWKDFTYDTTAGKGSVGELAQGKWQFEVQCLQNVEGADPVVVYATAAAVETYINASTTTVEVTVVRQSVTGTGTLIIDDVTAPAYSEWVEGDCDYLVISGDFGDAITIYSSGTGDDNRSTFADEGKEVAAGIYTMTFTVYDKDDNKVGAATKVVEIGVGVETTVSGALDAGTWVEGFLSVVVKTIELEITAPTDDVVECAQGDKVEFAFTGTITPTPVTEEGEEEEEITYTLYYSESSQDAGTGASGEDVTFEWDTAAVAPGYYEVHIVASATGVTTDGGDEAVIKVIVHEEGWTAQP